MNATSLSPVLTVDLFPELQDELLKLLRGLSPEEWSAPTICEGWSVKDIAQHLLGDTIGIVSGLRDRNPRTQRDEMTWDELVTLINSNNNLWVRATRRISTRMLCSLLESTGQEMIAHFQSLDPSAPSVPVSWASPEPAPAWLEIAREYTEFWTHQQQIRDAVHKPGLKDRRFLHPVLDAFVLALPRTYRDVDAKPDTLVKLVISGEAGGEWYLVCDGNHWTLYSYTDLPPVAVVMLDTETAWRLFTRGISREQAKQHANVGGDTMLGSYLLDTVSIIA